MEYPEKRPLGTEVQTLLQRTWLGFTTWQKSHCGASLMGVNRNPLPRNLLRRCLSRGAPHKASQHWCWGSCCFYWPLCLKELGTGETAFAAGLYTGAATCAPCPARGTAAEPAHQGAKPFPPALSTVSLQCPVLTKLHMVQLSEKKYLRT